MERREFIAGLGASMLTASWFGYVIPGRRPDTALVGSLGTWAHLIALDVAAQWPQITVVTADKLLGGEKPGHLAGKRIVLVGALGGRTGLAEAAAYAEVSESNQAELEAIVFMPGEWEGSRRMKIAQATLRTLGRARVPIQAVGLDPDRDQTLQTWGEARGRAMRENLLGALRRHQA